MWNELLGIVQWNEEKNSTFFEFNQNYPFKGQVPAPILMPYPKEVQKIYGPFYYLTNDSFEGLPPMIADSLPDSFGKKILSKFLASQELDEELSPLQRLSYVGTRAMGALEFRPAQNKNLSKNNLNLEELADLSVAIVNERKNPFKLTKEEIAEFMTVGTSAGGARPKAILSKNFKTNEFAYSYEHRKDFIPIIIKFDMIDPDDGTALSYGKIEYCYHKMALDAKIDMTACGVFYTKESSHFYTHRFDRSTEGEKIHLQTFAGISGLNPRELHPYEKVFDTMLLMNLNYYDLEQQFRRMVFNYFSANDDCHIKNISFLMDKTGKWKLSPAYDITFPYNYKNIFKRTQPLSINGKIKDIQIEDFLSISAHYGIKSAKKIIEEVKSAVLNFEVHAEQLALNPLAIKRISSCFRIPEF